MRIRKLKINCKIQKEHIHQVAGLTTFFSSQEFTSKFTFTAFGPHLIQSEVKKKKKCSEISISDINTRSQVKDTMSQKLCWKDTNKKTGNTKQVLSLSVSRRCRSSPVVRRQTVSGIYIIHMVGLRCYIVLMIFGNIRKQTLYIHLLCPCILLGTCQ